MLPSVFRSFIGLFVSPHLDAPDNWAVALTRILWLLLISGGIGIILSSLGLWLSWRPPRRPVRRTSR